MLLCRRIFFRGDDEVLERSKMVANASRMYCRDPSFALGVPINSWGSTQVIGLPFPVLHIACVVYLSQINKPVV